MGERINNFSVSVGTSNVEVVPKTFINRVGIIITNTSTAGQKIYLAVNQEASIGNGIFLNPGGVYQDTNDSGYKASREQINAIADAAGGTLAVLHKVGDNNQEGY